MKAYGKRRLSVAQQEAVQKAVIAEFDKYKRKYEEKVNARAFFLHYLTLSIVLEEVLHFGEQRRAKILKACMAKVNELSDHLVKNKCETPNGNERYDTDYNRETLKRLAEQYHIAWDEEIFNDDVEERECKK